jgi:hypothetical protein
VSDGAQDLTGIWYGRYEAVGYPETNTFIANLTDDDGALSGTITEPDTNGSAAVRRAFVKGSRTGTNVLFVKQYDGAVLAHAVRYFGVVNGDSTQISGRWQIVRERGVFTMEREKFAVADIAEEQDVEEIVR